MKTLVFSIVFIFSIKSLVIAEVPNNTKLGNANKTKKVNAVYEMSPNLKNAKKESKKTSINNSSDNNIKTVQQLQYTKVST